MQPTQLQMHFDTPLMGFKTGLFLEDEFYFATAGWYDEIVDYDEYPQYHHYHCGREDCEYCKSICYALSHGFADSLHDFISYYSFIIKWPKIYRHDGSWYRHTIKWNKLPFIYYEDLLIYYEDLLYLPHHHHHHSDEEFYSAGEEIDPSCYQEIENCWIAPSGILHYVSNCGHYETAQKLGFASCYDCEGAGYIHVSGTCDLTYPFISIPKKPTHEQMYTVYLYCAARELSVPKGLSYECSKESDTFPFWQRIDNSCKPRSFRDRFYPLSGD